MDLKVKSRGKNLQPPPHNFKLDLEFRPFRVKIETNVVVWERMEIFLKNELGI